VTAGRIGRVDQHDVGLRWRVVFPDLEHEAASSFLRELAASDCSPATVRSYAFALLRWFRFVHDRLVFRSFAVLPGPRVVATRRG
jgi:integrase/recombinase XerC